MYRRDTPGERVRCVDRADQAKDHMAGHSQRRIPRGESTAKRLVQGLSRSPTDAGNPAVEDADSMIESAARYIHRNRAHIRRNAALLLGNAATLP